MSRSCSARRSVKRSRRERPSNILYPPRTFFSILPFPPPSPRSLSSRPRCSRCPCLPRTRCSHWSSPTSVGLCFPAPGLAAIADDKEGLGLGLPPPPFVSLSASSPSAPVPTASTPNLNLNLTPHPCLRTARQPDQEGGDRLAAMAMNLMVAWLRPYVSTDPSKLICVSIHGKGYTVASDRGFYGPNGAYAMFIGRETSHALARMSNKDADVSGHLFALSDKGLGVLTNWETKVQTTG